MKNNLFLIHTPMQLFVAQQLISQEQLQNNIMLYGYVPGNEHFLEIYKLMLISSMWKETIPRTIGVGWALVDFRHIISSTRAVKKNFKVIERFIKEKEIGALYLGDISNRGHQLLAKIFKGQVKIVFFEEGSSHYVKQRTRIPDNFVGKMKMKAQIFLLDNLLFKPMWGFKYTKEFFFEFIDRDEIPMDERYSILPFYHQPYDKQLKIKKLFSEELKKYLLSEIESSSEKKGLQENNYLLSSPAQKTTDNRDIPLNSEVIYGLADKKVYLFISSLVYEITTVDDFIVEEAVIEDMAKQIEPDSVLFVKFHPREKKEHMERMLSIFNKYSFEYRILGKTYNIPVEYYLQCLTFSKVFAFANSSIFYNGILFPIVEFERLDLAYLEKYQLKKLPHPDRIQQYCDSFTKSIDHFKSLLKVDEC